MPQYKVELVSIDRKDETQDIHFTTFVVAGSSNEAVEKAKLVQKQEKPELNPADIWGWLPYETAEKHD